MKFLSILNLMINERYNDNDFVSRMFSCFPNFTRSKFIFLKNKKCVYKII